MKILIILTVIAVCESQNLEIGIVGQLSKLPQSLQPIEPLVTGGIRASRGQFPYQVALLMSRASGPTLCGGTLIKPKWVVTSAACLDEAPFTNLYIFLGVDDFTTETFEWRSESLSMSNIYLHPDYNRSKYTNNIALIHVEDMPSDIMNNAYIGAIELPTEEEARMDFTGRDAVFSGYGRESDATTLTNGTLNYITPKIINTTLCNAVSIYTVTNSNLCIDTTNGRSPCAGDSGSPLTVQLSASRKILVGISSIYTTTCTIGNPSLFESVSYHREWILKTSGSSIINLSASMITMVIAMILKKLF